MEVELLKQGWAVGYLECLDMLGSDAALEVMDHFTHLEAWSQGLHLPWAMLLEDELPLGTHTVRVRLVESPPFLAELPMGHEPGGARLRPSLVQVLVGVARRQPRPTRNGRFMGSSLFLLDLLSGHEPGGARLLPSLVQVLVGMARQQPRPTRNGWFMGSALRVCQLLLN